MQSFDEVLFTMTSIFAKKLEKYNTAGWRKKSKSFKWPQKFFNYDLQWYLTGDQKNNCIYFWKLGINAKLKEHNEKKKDVTLSISKNFATMFDHWLDLIEADN